MVLFFIFLKAILFFIFFKSCIVLTIVAVPIYIPTTVYESPIFSAFSSPLVIYCFLFFLNDSHSDKHKVIYKVISHKVIFHYGLTCIFLLTNDVEYFFMYLLVICMSFLQKCLSSSSASLKLQLFDFWCC